MKVLKYKDKSIETIPVVSIEIDFLSDEVYSNIDGIVGETILVGVDSDVTIVEFYAVNDYIKLEQKEGSLYLFVESNSVTKVDDNVYKHLENIINSFFEKEIEIVDKETEA